MNKSNVSFYGYNDGKAMTIYTCIMLFVPTFISFSLSIIVSIVAICLNNYYLLFIWFLSGLKDKGQKIKWPWMWETISY